MPCHCWHVPIFVKGELCLLFDFFRDIVCFFSLFEDLCLFISRNVFSCTTQPESSGCECVARVATPGSRQLPVKSPYTKTHLNIYCNNYNVIQMNPIVCLALTFKGLFFHSLFYVIPKGFKIDWEHKNYCHRFWYFNSNSCDRKVFQEE